MMPKRADTCPWKNAADSRLTPSIQFIVLGSNGMKRFPVLICLAFLLLIIQVGITSATTPETTTATAVTTTATAADTASEDERTGGSIYFETFPSGATIWLDNVEIGTSAFTYYTEKTGTREVRTWRKGYENYTGTVTVSEGRRVVFSAVLTPVLRDIIEEKTPPVPVATATTIRKSTLSIPTPWPSPTESPVNPVAVVVSVALSVGFFVIRRR